MDDIKLRTVFLFTLLIGGGLLGGSLLYMDATIPQEPPGPTAFANTTYYPASQTASVSITAYYGASRPEGTVKAEAEWTKNGTVYRTKVSTNRYRRGVLSSWNVSTRIRLFCSDGTPRIPPIHARLMRTGLPLLTDNSFVVVTRRLTPA